MRYISTRGAAPALGFEEVLLAGLASDGGLYVPETWPRLGARDIAALEGLSYAELAARILAPYVDQPEDELAALAADSYAGFDHPDVAPLTKLGDGEWLLELFHGPTLSFKDYALQLVGRLFERALGRRGARTTILGATSGDTGSAAIAACAGRAGMEIFMLHPAGRVSEVQRRQMTTVRADNVHNIAIDGTFDDCQDLVKALFGDARLREELSLSAVNSINWARIAAQCVYYFAAASSLGAGGARGAAGGEIAFAVPTGNFGNVFAGHAARRMGLGVARLIVGSNRNDILTRFFETGAMETRTVQPTLSPSMDIQISSNFERLAFELCGRDGAEVADLFARFRTSGRLELGEARWHEARKLFAGFRLDDDGTLAAMRQIHEENGVLVDPHSAVGIMAGRARRKDLKTPLVAIATAHPAKFPDAVERATGTRPALPGPLADLYEREESYETMANDMTAVRDFLLARARPSAGTRRQGAA